ncbi:hypothetical protein HV341_06610 [Citrobacter sp. RHBSTW-00976]|uniref:hypothetical protein n=1 Tax=Citrobacter sp. RHBSTW-00976 TaxID=2742674 RepID=UPI0015EA2EF5|nr:hypothetical protein [Citrobacter sp. RHBSTW-00976]QLR61757.1 hypothetical protein HV341_06610 [Citrobacter sp. RHBSTW-00976]
MINKVLFQSMLIIIFTTFSCSSSARLPHSEKNEYFNDKALVAEAKYSFIDDRDNNLFVDGKYNKSYVDKMYDTYSIIYQENSINYYLMLKSGGLLKKNILKTKEYLNGKDCETAKYVKNCIFMQKRIDEMYNLSLMIDNGMDADSIRKDLYNDVYKDNYKVMLMNKYIETHNYLQANLNRD